ncbi:Protoglobin-domain-containing protein [Chytridium lagenaria]|nr:Protoglobin-domain-containing protein [Chytridium lagenaria]
MTSTSDEQMIDRDRLYTDTMYRFKYVSGFVDFGASDIAALKDAAPLIAPLVPTVVDAVYSRLFSYDITKQVFLQRNDGYTGTLATNLKDLTQTQAQIQFRKSHLSKYLVKLVTAEYDEKFVMYLEHVGKIHTNTPGKKSKINVEYIHVNALFGWLHGFLAEVIDQHEALQGDAPRRAKLISALSKLLWIQNDLFAKFYVKEGDVEKGMLGGYLKSMQARQQVNQWAPLSFTHM